MKTIQRGYRSYEFQDNDPRHEVLQQLIELEKRGDLLDMDVDVIGSMFSLHETFPSLPETLFEEGFTMPTNEGPSDHRHAVWTFGKTKEELRIVEYERRSWWTMWMRSDHYHIDIVYRVGERLVATYHYRDCEMQYGEIKVHKTYCSIKKDDKLLLEFGSPIRH